MRDEVGRTTLQLVKQNHVTIEKTLSSVNDRTITLLDNHFFSDSKQYSFWTNIETLGQIREADAILERWSSDGTEYTLYMMNTAEKSTPLDLSYKTKGFKYFNKDIADQPEWAERSLREGGAGTLHLLSSESGVLTVSFMRSILNPEEYDESIGFLIVSKLEVLLNRDIVSVQLPKNAGIYLFNDQNEQLMKAGPEDSQMAEIAQKAGFQGEGYYFASAEGKKWLYAFSHRSAFNTRLIYKIPLDSITGNQTVFQWTIMIISAVYLAFVLIFVLYLLRIIVTPLIRLVSITKIYEPGKQLDREDKLLRSDEFGILYGAFLKMMNRLDRSIEENYGMKIKQKENELATLHSQITPHLLYNTLDSIYWYALDSGNTEVGEMVKDLSRLLRIGLSKGKSMITIAEEVEHVQAYSRLQMKRYPGQFEVFWHIDEDLTTYMTPKVILQPLVENAIFHSVSSMDGEGSIWIGVRCVDKEIQMTVEDNGFLPVDMERLNHIVNGDTNDKGYGIRNVHQRIQLHYGDQYRLRYERREGGGIVAIINLPMQEKVL
ncbi:sensor histidine kinase [Paenibacillus gorillae]|uniref:sensor histidine kinase n=1 Tax=Paenibacillus gorillae TaxID=1243662 RepID=UPI0004AD665E|nr:sensor histidine kinase [Paenibacillus gorillae]